MKAFLAIFITACLWAACWVVSALIYFDLSLVLVWVTSIWAAIDASRIGLNRYKFSTACRPIIVFCLCYIFWVIFFPWYLWARFSIKDGAFALKDETVSDLSQNAFKRFFQRLSRRLQPAAEWCLIGIVALKIAFLGFCIEESWRGQHEWNKYRHELEAKGESFDWDAMIPPPVPDSKNIYSAPMMSEWFVRHQGTNAVNNELSKILLNTNATPVTIVEVTVMPSPPPKVASTNFDISLQYCSIGESLFPEDGPPEANASAPSNTSSNTLPVSFDSVPLDLAIKSLVRLKHMKSAYDTNIYSHCAFDTNYFTPRFKEQMPLLTVRWENVTPQQALAAILNAYDLQAIDNSQAGVTLITKEDLVADRAIAGALPFSLAATNQVYPIVFEDVPVTTAVESLARLCGINYLLDPNIGYNQPDADGQIKPEPLLNIRWSRMTPQRALMAVLNENRLQLIYDPEIGVARITPKAPDAPKTYTAPEIHEKLVKLFSADAGTNIFGVQGSAIFVRPLNQIKPVRILLHSDTKPTQKELVDMFRDYFPVPAATPPATGLVFSSVGTNSYRVMLKPASSAVDYLAWSDRFKPNFDLIQEALKRPYARLPGDYSYPPTMPIPNFIAVRVFAQTLAQRAQCYLLLGQPDKALQELTLLHESCRLLEGAPTGKPMTLVSAMIDVAVTGLYVDVIADGFRFHVWKEPQLLALQKQLEQVNMTPMLQESFRGERVSHCRILQDVMTNYVTQRIPSATLWQKVKSLRPPIIYEAFFDFNILNVAKLDQMNIDSIAPRQRIVLPQKAEELQRAVDEMRGHYFPYKLFAAIAVPNGVRALQTSGFNQTRADEAQIVCALERYRLSNGKCPDTLNELVPKFIDTLPHDIIGGQPLKYHLSSDGQFVLYSIGWNETDDGGEPSSTQHYDKGDWVW